MDNGFEENSTTELRDALNVISEIASQLYSLRLCIEDCNTQGIEFAVHCMERILEEYEDQREV